MIKHFHILSLIGVLTLLIGCTPPVIDQPSLSKGNIDFSNYVALGNDYAIGLTDFGVFESGQRNCYPALLAHQFDQIEKCAFPQAYLDKGMDSYWRIDSAGATFYDCMMYNAIHRLEMTGGGITMPHVSGSVHNIASPCVRLSEINNPIHCPYLKRLDNTEGSYINLIHAHAPTFFTMDLGMADVWKYAYWGGSNSSLPSEETFEHNYIKVLDALKVHTDKGVIMTIPDITLTPYLASARNLFVNPNNCEPVAFYLEVAPGVNVQGANYELIPLNAKWEILSNQRGFSRNNPLINKDVLTAEEAQLLKNKIVNYNTIIRKLAAQYQYPLLDLEKIQKGLKAPGIQVDGVNITDEYILGGFYSLDGYTPTARGQALITNNIIRLLNHTYNASIPLLNLTEYPTLDIKRLGQYTSYPSSK